MRATDAKELVATGTGPGRPRPGRWPWPVAVAVALVLSACGVTAGDGTTSASSRADADVIGSKDAPSSTTSPPTTAPPPTDLEIRGDDGSEGNRIAANAIVDLEAWWTDIFPEVYDGPYQPVSGGFYAIDSSTDVTTLPCNPTSLDQVLQNAFYCPEDDAVAWDQEGLMPDLAATYGDFTVAVVLAHEWGHAIQERAQVVEPTVTMELQADCFAGAWVEHVDNGSGSRFDITTQDLDQALAGVLSLRDAPGSGAESPNAHGSGFDRVNAFQEGYEDGAGRCVEYTDGDPTPYVFPFTDQEWDNQGNMPFDGPGDTEGINRSAFASLADFWAFTFPDISDGKDWVALETPVAFGPSSPPTCNGRAVTDYRLFLCIPDRFIGYDVEEALPQAYELGDFAVATLYATQYGLWIQHLLGDPPDNQVTLTLRGDCYAGAWAGALLPGQEQPWLENEEDGLQLSGGDLDEAIAVLLTSRTDADRARQGPGFARTKAFRTGVLKGPDSCADVEAP